MSAARRALRDEIARRVRPLELAGDERSSCGPTVPSAGRASRSRGWGGTVDADAVDRADARRPVRAGQREKVRARLSRWLEADQGQAGAAVQLRDADGCRERRGGSPSSSPNRWAACPGGACNCRSGGSARPPRGDGKLGVRLAPGMSTCPPSSSRGGRSTGLLWAVRHGGHAHAGAAADPPAGRVRWRPMARRRSSGKRSDIHERDLVPPGRHPGKPRTGAIQAQDRGSAEGGPDLAQMIGRRSRSWKAHGGDRIPAAAGRRRSRDLAPRASGPARRRQGPRRGEKPAAADAPFHRRP